MGFQVIFLGFGWWLSWFPRQCAAAAGGLAWIWVGCHGVSTQGVRWGGCLQGWQAPAVVEPSVAGIGLACRGCDLLVLFLLPRLCACWLRFDDVQDGRWQLLVMPKMGLWMISGFSDSGPGSEGRDVRG
jgi:hypothetical protein